MQCLKYLATEGIRLTWWPSLPGFTGVRAFFALFGPRIAPYGNPLCDQTEGGKLKPPSIATWFGTEFLPLAATSLSRIVVPRRRPSMFGIAPSSACQPRSTIGAALGFAPGRVFLRRAWVGDRIIGRGADKPIMAFPWFCSPLGPSSLRW